MTTRPAAPGDRTPLDARIKALAVLTAVAAALALLQRSTLAPLPHGTDDFLGGVAVGLAVNLAIGWLALRD